MRKYCMAIFIITASIVGCQKETSVENSIVEPVQNILDSNRLLKYIEFDTTHISGLDTLDIAKYNYDNFKRLTLLEYTEFDGAGLKFEYNKVNLYYNGVDTLPSKRIRVRYALPSLNIITTDTNFYAFSNGRIVLDSNTFSVTKFSYINNNVTEKIISNFPGTPVDSNKYYMTRLNGNLILQKDTISGNSVFQNFSFNYDAKNNPFFNIPIPLLERVRPYYKLELYSDEMIYEKNNPVEIMQTSSTSTFHFKYSYEYNLNGYPKIARVTDQIDTAVFFKIKYFYTSL